LFTRTIELTIRIVLADDHPFILDGVDLLFRSESDCEVVARTTDGEETIRAVEMYQPDVLVLDVRMPKIDGIEVLAELQRLQLATRVILLTASLDDARLLEAFRLGASGLVLKESAPRLLIQSVRQVARGEQSWNGQAIAGALRLVLQRELAAASVFPALTAREIEVTRMVADGLRNKEIAARLAITEATVKFHLHSIYEKLHIDGRYALIGYARDHALV
jgi:DNA-binding NarL/FixJ family response regulator